MSPDEVGERLGSEHFVFGSASANVIPRGGGEDHASHIVVTRDGVGVLSGGIGEDVQAVRGGTWRRMGDAAKLG